MRVWKGVKVERKGGGGFIYLFHFLFKKDHTPPPLGGKKPMVAAASQGWGVTLSHCHRVHPPNQLCQHEVTQVGYRLSSACAVELVSSVLVLNTVP